MPGIGKDVLLPLFDVWEGNEDFLCEIYDSLCAPQHELEHLFDESLVGGAQNWGHHMACALALRKQRGDDTDAFASKDLLDYLRIVWKQQQERLDEEEGCATENHDALGWEETDRLLARAKDLEERQQALLRELGAADVASEAPQKRLTSSRKRKRTQNDISPFFSADCEAASGVSRREDTKMASHQQDRCTEFPRGPRKLQSSELQTVKVSTGGLTGQDGPAADGRRLWVTSSETWLPSPKTALRPAGSNAKATGVSPFFQASSPEAEHVSPNRPLTGTVSSIPFPSLDAPRFGIIQELEAHDPFWLLIVVTFLIKTQGRTAVPAFRKLREKFPAREQLADPANAAEILDMIRHLGLGTHRLRFMQNYARTFLADPPQPGTRYRVKGYARRESVRPEEEEDTEGDAEAWEIGHMTKGRYALDSWRIFCRDALLGKAEDYNGKGARGEFQPEWMRVLPADKELRAFLRWMWMREGWEWDPATGEKRVLRREMEAAVNEGRVGYDEEGGLRILNEPRDGFTRESLVVR